MLGCLRICLNKKKQDPGGEEGDVALKGHSEEQEDERGRVLESTVVHNKGPPSWEGRPSPPRPGPHLGTHAPASADADTWWRVLPIILSLHQNPRSPETTDVTSILGTAALRIKFAFELRAVQQIACDDLFLYKTNSPEWLRARSVCACLGDQQGTWQGCQRLPQGRGGWRGRSFSVVPSRVVDVRLV